MEFKIQCNVITCGLSLSFKQQNEKSLLVMQLRFGSESKSEPQTICCDDYCLKAIFCKSHPTCDSRVFRISSYFNKLKIKVILEYGRNFSFINHFVEFLGGSRDNSSFSRNAISVHKLYFESLFSLLELLFRVQVTST